MLFQLAILFFVLSTFFCSAIVYRPSNVSKGKLNGLSIVQSQKELTNRLIFSLKKYFCPVLLPKYTEEIETEMFMLVEMQGVYVNP